MRKSILLLILICRSTIGSGQVTVEECRRLAQENYPLVQRYGLIEAGKRYDLSNASKALLPQFALSGKASWQSEVTRLPISIPGYDIPMLSKDQYQALAEVSQVIWDGGATRASRQAVQARGEVDRAQFEVDMYALNERIDNLFFGVLLLDEQVRLNDLYLDELKVNHDRVASYIENGVANRTDLDAIRVEQLAAGQNRILLQSTRSAYLQMLSAFTGRPLPEDTELVKPAVPAPPASAPAENRPEMRLFEAAERQLETQRKAIQASLMPQLGLFVQGGYGKPGLNMLRDEFRTFAIGGVRLSWNFGHFYTRRNNLGKIENGLRETEVQREIFLFNNSLEQTRLKAEYRKYRQVMADDDEMIRLRENIVRASEAKFENGVISASDLIRDLVAEQHARVGKALHEIELLKTIYQIKNLVNDQL